MTTQRDRIDAYNAAVREVKSPNRVISRADAQAEADRLRDEIARNKT